MAGFGGKKYGLDSQARGAAYYGLTEDELRGAWEWYQRGLYVSKIVDNFRPFMRRRLSHKKLIVEWGALGLPVHVYGRRSKLRDATSQALTRLQERFDMPTTATMYAALRFAEAQGADLRAVVAEDFGAPPKRPRPWYTPRRVQAPVENLQKGPELAATRTMRDPSEL